MQPKPNISPVAAVSPVASADSAAVQSRSASINSLNNAPTYPYPDQSARLQRYNFNSLLFDGNHFDAFKIKVDNEQYNKNYSKLRYLVHNFPGLISKICADMLFGTVPRITLPEGANNDDNADWLEAFLHDTDFFTTCYESAMTASYKGDTIFKIRIGELNDPTTNSIIIEQVQPDFFFPTLDPLNASANPKQMEISFVIQINGDQYLRKEVHTAGQIENSLWKLNGNQIIAQVPLSMLGDPDLQDVEQTGIDRLLLVHLPNWKDGRTYFGNDDYQDLSTLFYAVNNRMTKIDNVLDKHTDPILAIPEGVLDEEGKVRREHLNLFEVGEDGNKPEYVVWNAQLESGFSEVDRIIQSLYMFSEIAPDAFGQVAQAAASGRALKYRLMRTVAKINRKKIYFDRALKEVIYIAQLLAYKYDVPALGESFSGAPEIPSINWADPIPQDTYEQVQEEELRLASGNQTLQDSIVNIDKLTDEEAAEKVDAIQAEKKKLNPPVPVVQVNAVNPKDPEAAVAVPGQAPSTTPSGAPMPTTQSPFATDVATPKVGKANPPTAGG
jgi:hypothetical protein